MVPRRAWRARCGFIRARRLAWATRDGSFTDPRLAIDGEPFGGTPRDYLHYKGLYRHGDQVVFSYSVNGMDVLELPGDKAGGNDVAFTRTFAVGASTVAQKLILAEVEGGYAASRWIAGVCRFAG